jgi:hypothetical protein
VSKPETFNIAHFNPNSAGQVPIPIRFHVTREIWEDETVTDEEIARLLLPDLVLGVAAHRAS